MNHAEVAHRWASGTGKGSSARLALWFEGDTIYSWGRHWPIARLVTVDGQRAVIWNGNRRSNSTSKHTLHTRRAVSHLPCYEVCRGEVATLPQRMTADEVALAVQRQEVARAESANYNREERKRRARERRQWNKRKAMDTAEKLQRWRAGESFGSMLYSLYSLPVAVRLSADGKDVETSHGARVRLKDALRLFRLCQHVRAGDLMQRDSHSLNVRIGLFELRAIDAEGNATVGCHRLAFAEMAALFDTLTPEQTAAQPEALEVCHA